MLAIVRGRVQHYAAQKMTLAQIVAERPTIDFDGRYAAPEGPASAQSFIEAVHRGVVAGPGRGRS
jgi:hypothetical protein